MHHAEANREACELSIVMPCLNEAETLAICIDKARGFLARNGVAGEVIVADNGSTDGSQAIARAHGARVVDVPIRGYGAAILGGTRAARGEFVVMGDADDSYDFSRLEPFLAKLREGHDLVMGNRFRGGIEAGAMPPLHRYLGNPVLSGIGRLFFGARIGDFHCGLRGFRRAAILGLGLQTPGMELASEMVVKATLQGLRIAEVPTTLSPDGRSRPPHLRSWRDGWRHLRFLLMYSPRWLFLYPGLALIGVGLGLIGLTLPGMFTIRSVNLDVHTMVVAAAAVIVGTQTVSFAWLSKQYGIAEGFLPRDRLFDRLRPWMTLERLLVAGGACTLSGLAGIGVAVSVWGMQDFGGVDYRSMMRLVVPSVLGLAIGVQAMFTAFLSSILDIKAAPDPIERAVNGRTSAVASGPLVPSSDAAG